MLPFSPTSTLKEALHLPGTKDLQRACATLSYLYISKVNESIITKKLADASKISPQSPVALDFSSSKGGHALPYSHGHAHHDMRSKNRSGKARNANKILTTNK